jgi:hypothetical protein
MPTSVMDPSAVDKTGAPPFVAATPEQDNRSHQRFSGEGLSLAEREWEEAHAHDPPPQPKLTYSPQRGDL